MVSEHFCKDVDNLSCNLLVLKFCAILSCFIMGFSAQDCCSVFISDKLGTNLITSHILWQELPLCVKTQNLAASRN